MVLSSKTFKAAHQRTEKGATMIEFILFFPVFLCALYLIIWLGVIVNARGALRAAVDNGVRLAATRGKAELYGKTDPADPVVKYGAIPDIDRWVYTNTNFGTTYSGSSNSPDRSGLLTQKPQDIQKYDQGVAQVFSGLAPNSTGTYNFLSEMPPEISYAIAYIVQNLRMGVGESLRYPCNPRGPDGDNCLLCLPINPTTFDQSPMVANAADINSNILNRRFAIKCEFKPAPFLLRPLLNLIAMVSGQNAGSGNSVGVISYYSFFDSSTGNCFYEDPPPSSGFPTRFCCKAPGQMELNCR